MSDRHFFAYGHLPPITTYIEQRGARFNLLLGPADPFGLTRTRRPILWATYPGRGNARTARRWFKQHAARHKLEFVFDR
ncbi:MAG TPA: hypothetical protein VNZ53_04100 [Steroidobacteraceae bacterium]|nr:hypothetical protein [Steroidobacteraceae bacterium]